MKTARSFPFPPKKVVVCLAASGTLLMLASRAMAQQYSDITVTNSLKLETVPAGPNKLDLYSNGVLISLGPRVAYDAPFVDLSGIPQASSLFYWDPGRVALRAGFFHGEELTAANVGSFSAAFGAYNTAGNLSFSGGIYSQASGWCSFAFGQVAIVSGNLSFATGDGTSALGQASFAGNFNTTASGAASAALGHSTVASGMVAVALGIGTRAEAYASLVIGSFNVVGSTGTGGSLNWHAEDPIFEIGNGTDWWHTSNALTVYKSGRIIIPKRQGDILMGEFGN